MNGDLKRCWGWREAAVLAPVYAVAAWQPVNIVAAGRGDRFGVRGWPMLTVAITVVVSVLAVALVTWALMRRGAPRWVCALLVVAGYAACIGVYLAWVGHYAPITDRATALEIGWRALASGENPYAYRTQLGNTLAPMLGGILLAGPFVAVFGNLWWYGITWLAIALGVTWRAAGASAAAAVAVLVALNPTMRLELYSQSDSWLNAFYLVLFGSLGYMAAGRPTARGRVLAGVVGVLFGLALAYRFIYAPVVLPLMAVMLRHHGLRATARFAVPAGLVSVVLAVIPWIVDPTHYGPGDAVDHVRSGIPYFGLILGVTVVATYALGALAVRSLAAVWGIAALALSLMVVLLGWGRGWQEYETVAYNGAILMFLLAALVIPTGAGETTTAPARANSEQRP